MNNPFIIAVDAMGGDDAPNKVIEGINIHSKISQNIVYKIFGNKNLIDPIIKKNKISTYFTGSKISLEKFYNKSKK